MKEKSLKKHVGGRMEGEKGLGGGAACLVEKASRRPAGVNARICPFTRINPLYITCHPSTFGMNGLPCLEFGTHSTYHLAHLISEQLQLWQQNFSIVSFGVYQMYIES